jgi:hypothetical protein
MKYDIVIGIIGKTHGVKMAARPNPKARARNPARLLSLVVVDTAVDAATGFEVDGLASM